MAQKYFSPWDTELGEPGSSPVRIGLLYNGNAELNKAFDKSLRAALAKYGHSITSTFRMTSIDQGSAAVLQFKEAGVTHVIGDFAIALFTQPAESQRYRPRYGLSTFSGGTALQLFSPPRQLRGSLGVGWASQGDVDAAQDPGGVGPAEVHCRKIMREAGEPTESRLAWFAMTWACDTFNFFHAVIDKSRFSLQRMPAAAASLGPMPPAFTFGIAFPAGRADGVTVVRDLGFREQCDCFAYLSRQNHRA